jgi:hypothetical protein
VCPRWKVRAGSGEVGLQVVQELAEIAQRFGVALPDAALADHVEVGELPAKVSRLGLCLGHEEHAKLGVYPGNPGLDRSCLCR